MGNGEKTEQEWSRKDLDDKKSGGLELGYVQVMGYILL
jgi:hypothetical protein